MLKGDLKNAVKIPSKSVLFNIDQKADVINASQVDAVLSVFVKVFNEMQGYFPNVGYIANFERDIDNQGLYETFKTAYAEETGVAWEKDRKRAHKLKNEAFARVFSNVSGMAYEEALKVLDKYESSYAISIEDFAVMVKEYIDKQEPGFRLNFFVDEVGQYIAENTKLMTNLQTIAESLATKCNGQSWILVTSQEDMGKVIGDMSRQQGNDFSKIKARFKTPLKLTSADVAEVIQKRLLEKNDQGQTHLSKIYDQEKNNFQTLFQFGDGAQTYRLYRDQKHFIYCYPFIPYQFTLFQKSIMGLSSHNAFEGKHSSVGERSMLGVFQDVAIRVSQAETGELATYDLMFEGIRATLKMEVQNSIHVAERNLTSEYAVKVLKALFLVKFVREFKASERNVAILMIDSFHCDLQAHEKKVKEALNLLEVQTYIQRNGEIYEFLTDEEKDIEQEIKNTEVDEAKINEFMADLIFKQILKDTKIRFEENKQDYSYARKLDETLIGHDAELCIRVVTPNNDNYGEEKTLVSQSMGLSELLCILPVDMRLRFDLTMYQRTEKYIQQNVTTTQSDAARKIMSHKMDQNRERAADLKKRLEASLGSARLFINGKKVEVSGSDARIRVHNAFQDLIRIAYPNLRMLKTQYTEENIRAILLDKNDDLFKHSDETLSEAEGEMLSTIQRLINRSERPTVKRIIEHFSTKPYGWYQAAILCVLGKLYMRSKLEVRQDSNVLEGRQVYNSFTNSREHANTLVQPQVEFSQAKVRKLKDFHQYYFNEANTGNEAKEVALMVQQKMDEEYKELERLSQQKAQYPFLKALDDALAEIWKVTNKDYAWYLNEVDTYADHLLNLKEIIIDPIRKFISGSQRQIFDDIRHYINENRSNFNYVNGNEAAILLDLMDSDTPYKGNQIQVAKQNWDTLKEKVEAALQVEKTKAAEILDTKVAQLTTINEFSRLDTEKRQQILQPWDRVRHEIETATLIPVVRDLINRFIEDEYQQILQRLTSYTYPLPRNAGNQTVQKNPPEFISKQQIPISFSKPYLETEADVEAYVAALKARYLEMVQNNKRISL